MIHHNETRFRSKFLSIDALAEPTHALLVALRVRLSKVAVQAYSTFFTEASLCALVLLVVQVLHTVWPHDQQFSGRASLVKYLSHTMQHNTSLFDEAQFGSVAASAITNSCRQEVVEMSTKDNSSVSFALSQSVFLIFPYDPQTEKLGKERKR